MKEFFEKYATSFSMLILTGNIIYLSIKISQTEQNVSNQVNEFMGRVLPMINIPDTAKRVVTPTLTSIQEFYYFEGMATRKSSKFINEFDYTPSLPLEVWNGYITFVTSNSGGQYWLWSQEKVAKGMPVKGWFLVAGGTFEIGYQKGIFAQLLFPVAPVNNTLQSLN